MCELCKRDEKCGMAHIGVYHVRDDRLAVLERDHQFVEHIRKHLAGLGLKDVMCKICNKTLGEILGYK